MPRPRAGLLGRGRGWCAVLALLVLMLVSIGSAPARAAVVGESALDRVGACIAAGGTGDILIALDTSGSLKKTDPDGVRIDAAKYFVSKLAESVQRSKVKVDVAVAGFDTGFHPGADWRSVDADSAPKLEEAIEQHRTQVEGKDTDYWAAVDGARKALLAKAHDEPQVRHCQLWFWFSDGKYDVEQREPGAAKAGDFDGFKRYAPNNPLDSEALTAEAMTAGARDLCRGGGQADQTRSAGITTVGIGLQPGDSKTDFGLMRGVAEGQGKVCGKVPARGAFYLATDVNEIYLMIDKLSTPGQPPLSGTAQICGAKSCPAGTHSFVLDSSINQARLLATSSAAGTAVSLVPPSGKAFALTTPSGQKSVEGVGVSWEWEPAKQTATVQLGGANAPGWRGQWQVVFTDPKAAKAHGISRTSIHLFGDLVPVWQGSDSFSFRQGTLAKGLVFDLRHAGSAQKVDPGSWASSVSLRAVLARPGLPDRVIADNVDKKSIGKPIDLDLTKAKASEGELRLTLNVTTAPVKAADGKVVAGTKLQPQSVSYPIKILPPANYPSVPQVISFGEVEGAEPVSAELPISGEGCVWLDGQAAAVTVPDGVSEVKLSSENGSRSACARNGKLKLTLSPAAAGNGLASGTFQVALAPSTGNDAAQTVKVRYELEMMRPANESIRWLTFALVFLLGVLLPLLALYAVKWWTARVSARQLFVSRTSGVVTDSTSFVSSAYPPNLTTMPSLSVGSGRHIPLPGGGALRAKMGWLPTESGYVIAELGAPSISSAPADQSRSDAKLPLTVAGHWIAVLNPSDPQQVELIYLVATGEQAALVHADAQRNLVRKVARLRGQTPGGSPPPPQNDPFAETTPRGGPTEPSTGSGWGSSPDGF